jgi:hypothetical protein
MYRDGSVYQYGDELTLGATTQYFAVAIDTPMTEGNGLDSYSRFGLYVQLTNRARSVNVPEEVSTAIPNDLILDTDERHFGLFYDIKKPVFFEGFIFHVYLGAGYSQQNIYSNIYELKSGNFEGSTALMSVKAAAGLAYRYAITESFGVRAAIDYSYEHLDSLKSISDDAVTLDNAGVQLVGGIISFDMAW